MSRPTFAAELLHETVAAASVLAVITLTAALVHMVLSP
jgi:hypothetical protein